MREWNRDHRLHYLTDVFPTVFVDVDTVDFPSNIHISQFDIFLLVSSIVMHIVDMCFDYNIAIQYFLIGKMSYFAWSICLILIPSLINVLVSKRMQQQDRERNSDVDTPAEHKTTHLMIKSKLYFVIAVLLELAPIIHYYQTLKYALRARKCKRSGDRPGERLYYKMMLKEDQDVALLRVFECFLEAAPQLILQFALILRHYDNRINLSFLHQAGTIISSLVSLGWAMASYHRSIRLAQQDKSKIGMIGVILQMLWHFSITVARIFSLSVVASIWPLYTVIGIIIHWISMTIWNLIGSQGILEFCKIYNRPPHIQPTIKERVCSVLFASVIGIVQIFIYLNTRDGNTFWKHMFFYILFFLENAMSNLLWRFFHLPKVTYMHYDIFFVISTFMFVFGITSMLMYYICFHPSKRYRIANAPLQMT